VHGLRSAEDRAPIHITACPTAARQATPGPRLTIRLTGRSFRQTAFYVGASKKRVPGRDEGDEGLDRETSNGGIELVVPEG
jgi:hypothetical protein